MAFRIESTWGPDALPFEQRRNEDVETISSLENIDGIVRASMEDGASNVTVTIVPDA